MLLAHPQPVRRRFSRDRIARICRLMLSALLLIVTAEARADGPASAGPKANREKTAQPEFDPGVLAGQVVSADGKPLVDAKVVLLSRTRRGARTDREGRFRFEFLVPGDYTIWASKGDLVAPRQAFKSERVTGFKTGRFGPMKLVASPGKEIHVLVTSAEGGKPVVGASVKGSMAAQVEAKTGDDGRAALRGLLPDTYFVTIQADGYVGVENRFDLEQAERVSNWTVALVRGGAIHGIVTDDKGQPVRGVMVYYLVEGTHINRPGRTPRTDTRGAFRNDSLPLNASVRVSTDKNDYLPYQQVVTLSPDRSDVELNIKLKPRPRGGSIAGTVVDEKGRPIAGATVENHGNSSNETRKATTDRDGNYALDDLLDSYAGYEVIIRARGRAPQRESVNPGPPGKPARVDFKLEPGHFLHGRLVGENGKPLAGAYVSLPGTPWPLADPMETDEQGRFEFDSLPGDAKFQISKAGYTNLQDVALKLDVAGEVTVVLQPMGVVRGRVVDAKSGKPIERFNVWINFGRERRRTDTRWTYPSELSFPGKSFDSKDGTFTLSNLMSGMPLELNVRGDGYLKTLLPRVVAAPADEAKSNEIALNRLDPRTLATLSGRIVNHAGRPVRGVVLRLIVSTERPTGPDDNQFNWVITRSGDLGTKSYCDQFLPAVSDKEGRFAYQNVLPDKYWQLAYWGEHVPQQRLMGSERTQAGVSKPITVTLPQPARIRGTIDRTKYADAGSVSAYRQGSAFDSADIQLSDGQTTFEFPELAAGDYYVSVQSKPVRSKEHEGMFTLRSIGSLRIQLKPGDTKSVRF